MTFVNTLQKYTNFWFPCNRGQSVVNFNDTIILANPENFSSGERICDVAAKVHSDTWNYRDKSVSSAHVPQTFLGCQSYQHSIWNCCLWPVDVVISNYWYNHILVGLYNRFRLPPNL